MLTRGVLDYAAGLLARARQGFVIPTVQDPVVGQIVRSLSFLRDRILLVLEHLKARADLDREHKTRIRRELENGTERYDDLPSPAPFQHFGLDPDVNLIRQKILDERSRLLEELRRLDQRFWMDQSDAKILVGELLASYVDLANRVEAATGQPVPAPSLEELFAFLAAPDPEEVVIENKPETVNGDTGPSRVTP